MSPIYTYLHSVWHTGDSLRKSTSIFDFLGFPGTTSALEVSVFAEDVQKSWNTKLYEHPLL